MASLKGFLGEAVQFAPVITLASSFIVSGGVDLQRAASLFVIAAVGAVTITAVLAVRRVLLNPILLGTNLWLFLGAAAFAIPVDPLAEWIGRQQAFGLYLCMLAVGVVLTFTSRIGYIGMIHPDRLTTRRLSLILLGLTIAATVWSFVFVDNIRLGGALPFIILNVTRRMMMRRHKHTSELG